MRNLTDIHNQLSVADQVYLEKRAEQIKIAEEEDAAGRIMARGFADELTKLAQPVAPSLSVPKPLAVPGGDKSVPAAYKTGGNTGGNYGMGGMQGRGAPKAPGVEAPKSADGSAYGGKSKLNPVTGSHSTPGTPKPTMLAGSSKRQR